MDWICPTCGKPNEAASGICATCFAVKPAGAVAEVPSQKELKVAAYAAMERPKLAQRYFSLEQRMPRRDFALVVLLAHLFLFASAMMEDRMAVIGTPPVVLLSLVLYFAAVFYAASKRCRDMNINPRWSLIFVFTYFGVFALLCFPGTKGANEYGTDPRKHRAAVAPRG